MLRSPLRIVVTQLRRCGDVVTQEDDLKPDCHPAIRVEFVVVHNDHTAKGVGMTLLKVRYVYSTCVTPASVRPASHPRLFDLRQPKRLTPRPSDQKEKNILPVPEKSSDTDLRVRALFESYFRYESLFWTVLWLIT